MRLELYELLGLISVLVAVMSIVSMMMDGPDSLYVLTLAGSIFTLIIAHVMKVKQNEV